MIPARAFTTGVTGGACGGGTEDDAEGSAGGLWEDEGVAIERDEGNDLVVLEIVGCFGSDGRGGEEDDGDDDGFDGKDSGEDACADGARGGQADTGGRWISPVGDEIEDTAGATLAQHTGAGVTRLGACCGRGWERSAGRGIGG